MDENLPITTPPTLQRSPKNNTRLVIVLVLIISALVAGYYFFYQNTNLSDISATTPNNESTINSFEGCMVSGGKDITPNYNALRKCVLENRIYAENCVSNNKYFVISKNKTDDVGTGILVKYKSSDDQIIPCEYSAESGDFEMGGDAEYVLALENNFLITDTGTGPDPRLLTVYDLNIRKKVYNDSYSQPVDIQNDTINYWTETTKTVTEENCPEFKEWKEGGLGAVIDAHVSLNLSNLTKKELGEYRCSPRQ